MVEGPDNDLEADERAARQPPAGEGARGHAGARRTVVVYIALGSNLGDREGTIRAALGDLEEQGDIRVRCCSSLHETQGVGGPPGQGPYLNAVAEVETELSPRALLERLQEVERRHGRRRTVPDAPRTLDLDLLLYGERVVNEPDLIVPHPRMWERPFVMEPLCEICDAETLETCRKIARTTPAGRASPP
jgi:2-amino-4-hydroxy-6-hydroxymethyldihydropteridine diphosphokinase